MVRQRRQVYQLVFKLANTWSRHVYRNPVHRESRTRFSYTFAASRIIFVWCSTFLKIHNVSRTCHGCE